MRNGPIYKNLDGIIIIAYCLAIITIFIFDVGSSVFPWAAIPFFFITGYSVLLFIPGSRSLDIIEEALAGTVISVVSMVVSLITIESLLGGGRFHETIVALSGLNILIWVVSLAGSFTGKMMRHESSLSNMGGRTIHWASSQSSGMKALLAIVLAGIVLMAGFSAIMLSENQSEKFSEFYILNEKGEAYDLPTNFIQGQAQNITLGIANHEGKKVAYNVEIWLVNYTNVNMNVAVKEMYFCKSINVTLDSTDIDLNDKYSAQYETLVNLDLDFSGNMTLFFLLYQGTSDPLPEYPLNVTTNYATNNDISSRILGCINNTIQYLSLNVDVIEAKTYLNAVFDPSELPVSFQSGIPKNVTINITNSEGHAIYYCLEVWAVNYTNIDMAVSVKQMYYLGSINVTLNDLRTNFTSSYQSAMSLNLTTTGNMSIFFILFKDGAEPLPEYPLEYGKDYATTSASWRIVLCVREDLQFLEIPAVVSA